MNTTSTNTSTSINTDSTAMSKTAFEFIGQIVRVSTHANWEWTKETSRAMCSYLHFCPFCADLNRMFTCFVLNSSLFFFAFVQTWLLNLLHSFFPFLMIFNEILLCIRLYFVLSIIVFFFLNHYMHSNLF